MIVNKKFDRLKQWGRERMGGEVRTATSEDFKALEAEMQLRHEGMEKLSRSTNAYMRSMSKREQGVKKEKQLPVAYFGSSMVDHGEDFEPESEFGQCLSSLGRANERIARIQETYCANAASSWSESLEHSLAQLKEYQSARKKLDQRRLAYDTAAQKMQRSKKEDVRLGDEVRSQKAKFMESHEDVHRRMLEIKDGEEDSVCDLTSFLDAELMYYDRCRELTGVQCRQQTAAAIRAEKSINGKDLRAPLSIVSRSSASSASSDYSTASDESTQSQKQTGNSFRQDPSNFDLPARPAVGRSTSAYEGPTARNRADYPTAMPRLSRVPTEPSYRPGGRSGLRKNKRGSLAATSDFSSD
nr:meiotically up-regulated gene 137 protein [Quercus suber]